MSLYHVEYLIVSLYPYITIDVFRDGDGSFNFEDNCKEHINGDQANKDQDTIGMSLICFHFFRVEIDLKLVTSLFYIIFTMYTTVYET